MSRLKLFVLPLLASLLIRLIYFTCWLRRLEIQAEADSNFIRNTPVIFAFWHGRQLFAAYLPVVFPDFRNKKISVLVSAHEDGRLIAKTVKYLGIDSVEGSSSRKTRASSRELLGVLRRDQHIAITPDGPKGPAQVAKIGVAKLALHSGAPVVPVAVSASCSWKFSSWDSMILPKPFSKMVFYLGKPVWPSEYKGRPEPLREAIEAALNSVCERADTLARKY
ncbi:MAG: lysophospholipid acyltransferase family protein [Bdellovibrionales bacterium]|nr:lysophospholipid acyltransferase family protein [Bdellovibrionales bacterium]